MPAITRRQFVRVCGAMAALPLVGCSQQAGQQTHQTTFFAFDTVCTLSGVMEESVLDEAAELCDRYEQLFSRTIATSDVARVNAHAGEAVEVEAETAELVRLALGYCEESGGLFDITIGAVSELWDFVDGVVPGESAIKAALPHVGWHKVQVGESSVQLTDPEARIDLGGIAKGYIADRVIDLFVERGVTSASVNLGGNVCVLGAKPNGKPWSVGVRDPFDESASSVVAKINSTGGSVVTSGLYERSFEKDGKRYWHILDPRTGYPVQTDVVSASIYAKKSLDGDGYTKPLFMLGESEALKFVEGREGLQAFLVMQDGTPRMSSGAEFELV